MYRTLKVAVLYVAKYCGLFAVVRIYTRKELRILCFHGLSVGDEHRFRPGLFMRPEVLSLRMKTLRDRRFPVISLDAALDGLVRGDIPKSAIVVTFDDGFYSIYSRGLAVLQQFEIPATIYVTTYYVGDTRPIFRLVVQYIFWKTTRTALDLSGLGLGQDGIVSFTKAPIDKVVWQIIEHAERHCDEDQRERLSRELSARLDVCYDELRLRRSLSLMTSDELRDTARAGVSLQLHTHRHRFPVEEHAARREIEDNRAFLESALGVPSDHFCYPSGLWSKAHWPWLADAKVRTAVTCDPGLNDAATPRLGLRRILDGDTVLQIEFEAELHGFTEIIRRLFARFRAIRSQEIVPNSGRRKRQIIA